MHTRNKVLIIAGTLVVGAVIGLASVPPARAAFEAVMSCAQTTPCLEWDNTSSGVAVKGVSTKGNALDGQTKFKSAGKSAGKAGVLGEDLSTSGTLNAGVLGTSTNGAGVMGIASTLNAVEGLSTSSTGVYGQTATANAFGAAGRNVAATHDNNGAGLLADGGSANDGLHAFAGGQNSVGVYAFSQNGTSLNLNQGPSDVAPELFMQGTGTSHDMVEATDSSGNDIFVVSNEHAVLVGGELDGSADNTVAATFKSTGTASATMWLFGAGSNKGNPVLSIFDASGNDEMEVTDQGNVAIHGLLFTGGSCHSGCLVNNHTVTSFAEYAPVEAEPTIEDNGEATLVNGRADVALDPKFANVIDAASTYFVSVTPDGDCRGLFVAQKTPTGFSVRELQGGRSTLAFDYRIVAKRYGVHAQRLPMFASVRVSAPHHQSRP